MKRQKILYIPIEESARDLETRLLLAHVAIADGWQVVLGQQWLMHAAAAHLPPGVFFFKGANERQRAWMAFDRAHGHAIVAIEEEATALAERLLLRRLMAVGAPAEIDLFLAQGPHQADILVREHPSLSDKIKITGVARFDLLTEALLQQRQSRVEKLVTEHGPFVLINTNFGYANTHWGQPERFRDEVLIGAGILDPDDPEDVNYWDKRLEFEIQTMAGFTELIDHFCPSTSLVVRPHIAEDLGTWEAMKEDRKWGNRVSIIRTGPAVDWIRASRLLVQNCCTTGIEASVMKHPVLSYMPYDNGFSSSYIVNHLVPPINDIADVDRLGKIAVGDQDDLAQALSSQVDNFERFYMRGEPQLATVRQWSEISNTVGTEAVVADDRLFKLPLLSISNRPDWALEKCKIDPAEVQSIIHYIGRALGRKLTIRSRVLGDDLVLLAPAGTG